MRAKYTKVRARSANEGSGTAGWSLATPVPACFLLDEEDIESVHLLFSNRERILDCKRWGSCGDGRLFPPTLQHHAPALKSERCNHYTVIITPLCLSNHNRHWALSMTCKPTLRPKFRARFL